MLGERLPSLILSLILVLSTIPFFKPVQAAWTGGSITIRADGSIDPPGAPLATSDGIAYYLTDDITIIGSNNGIVIQRNNIILEGNNHNITGAGGEYGISLDGRVNVMIRNIRIKGFIKGMVISSSSNNTIVGNVFTGCSPVVSNSYSNTVLNNTVNGRPLVYLENARDLIVRDAGQVILVRCKRIIVEKVNLSNTTIGIELWESNSSTIVNTVLNNNLVGIYLSESSNNTIANNTASDNGIGIYLWSSSNNNIIVNNTASDNGLGISLESSSNNIIANNTASDNGHGISLRYLSNNNIIVNNTISNNGLGISLYSSNSNSIHHNDFILNTQQVSPPFGYPPDSVNTWDDGYPSGGNYWSDYMDVDEKNGPNQSQPGGDGIWDHPYVIGVYNEDRYPLVNVHMLDMPSARALQSLITSPYIILAIVAIIILVVLIILIVRRKRNRFFSPNIHS